MKTKIFTFLALCLGLSVGLANATLTDPLVLSNFDDVNIVPDAFTGFTYTYITATGTNSSISTGKCLNVAKTVSGTNPLVFNGSGTGIFSGAGVSIGANASTQYHYLVIRAKKGNAAYTFNAKFENPVTVTSPVTLPLNIEPSNAYVAGSWVTYVFDLSRANNTYTKLSLYPENNSSTSNLNTQIDDIFFTNAVDASIFSDFTPSKPSFSRTTTDCIDILFRPIPNAVKYRVYSGSTLVQDNILTTTTPFPAAGFTYNANPTYSGIVNISNILTSRLAATITGLATNTTYNFSIVGVDVLGNETQKSTEVTANTRRTTAGVNYQLLDDFESGVYTNGPWSRSNNGTLTIPFTNPLTSGNNGSTNCVKFQYATNSADYAGLNGSYEGITTGTGCPYKYLHVKMYRTADAALSLKNGDFIVTLSNCKDHPELQTAGLKKSYSSISAGLGAWVDYVFDLSSLPYINTPQTFYSMTIRPNALAFASGYGCLSYIDDIYLSNDGTPLNAKFESVTISATAGTGGAVTGAGNYVNGNNVTLTATPSSGYRFVNWTNTSDASVASTALIYTFTASDPKSLIANFTPLTPVNVTSTLTNASSLGLTINSDVTVSNGGVLIINQSSTINKLTIQAGGKVTILADQALSSGSVIIENTATFVDKNTYTVTNPAPVVSATVNQTLTAGRNWYVSSPITSSTGLVSQLSSATSVVGYNESTGLWDTHTGALTAGKGYVSVSTTSNGDITFNGTLNTGDVTVSLTRSGTNTSKPGFNLVGNPYPSYINWTEATANDANVLTTIWYRTKNAGQYTFYTYNPVSDIAAPSTPGLTSYIPPMQAFWVRVKDSNGGVLRFTNAMREHDLSAGANLLKAPATKPQQKVLRLQVSNGMNSDETVLLFNDNASNEFDDYDSPKMMNNNTSIPEIFTAVGSENLVINGMKSLNTDLNIPLGIISGVSSNNLSIRAAQVSNFDGNTRIVLRDNDLGLEQDITDGAIYTFKSGVVNSFSRFSIIFKTIDVETGIENEYLSASKLAMFVYQNSNKQIVVKHDIAPNSLGKISIMNALGQNIVYTPAIGTKTIIPIPFNPGIYFISIQLNGKLATQKFIVY